MRTIALPKKFEPVIGTPWERCEWNLTLETRPAFAFYDLEDMQPVCIGGLASGADEIFSKPGICCPQKNSSSATLADSNELIGCLLSIAESSLLNLNQESGCWQGVEFTTITWSWRRATQVHIDQTTEGCAVLLAAAESARPSAAYLGFPEYGVRVRLLTASAILFTPSGVKHCSSFEGPGDHVNMTFFRKT